jgi:chitin disaccharide deacetylase
MRARKYLIVNADDFGLSPGVNGGVIKAHEQGIVTSASLMVRGSAARQAAEHALAHPALSVGLHVDLGEWSYANENWQTVYEVAPVNDGAAVAVEISRQLVLFRQLMGRNPTHLDSHQHVHREEPAASILKVEALRLGVVLRGAHPQVRYCGDFYGQSNKGYPYPEGISVGALLDCIQGLPDGITELGCHPADGVDMASGYGHERTIECSTLCDPSIKTALAAHQVTLCSFASLKDIVIEPKCPTL